MQESTGKRGSLIERRAAEGMVNEYWSRLVNMSRERVEAWLDEVRKGQPGLAAEIHLRLQKKGLL